MSDITEYPRSYPFGETEYHNFDPEQINTPSEAVEALEWIADENEAFGDEKVAGIFREAATMVEVCLVEENDE